jgi:HlyD family secretion protein
MPLEIDETGELIADKNGLSSNLFLRSTEVTEIISSKPAFLVRWGTTIFMVVVLAIVAGCWFIQYPDVVAARAKLTSINAPKEVKANTNGKLLKLLASEDQHVKQYEILGYLESRANANEVIALSAFIDSLQLLLNNNQFESVTSLIFKPYLHLGEVQQPYQTFIQSLSIFKQYFSTGFYVHKKAMLQKDLDYLQQMKANLVEQRSRQQEDLGLQKETFKANEYLLKEKVISPLEYRTERSKLISKEMSLPQISSNILTNENSRNEKQKEIMELENQIAQQKTIFLQALNTFKVQLDDWKAKFLLIAPVEGKVAFASFLQENQQLQNNQTICYINPGNSKYYAEILIPQTNFGKVRKHQKVLLQFASYPYQEYGKLEGQLEFISNIPTDSGYQAKVSLPRGLKTNYDKEIQYHDGLTAQGEIITKNMGLLERFYYNLRGISTY